MKKPLNFNWFNRQTEPGAGLDIELVKLVLQLKSERYQQRLKYVDTRGASGILFT
jgi:hypothetical protein